MLVLIIAFALRLFGIVLLLFFLLFHVLLFLRFLFLFRLFLLFGGLLLLYFLFVAGGVHLVGRKQYGGSVGEAGSPLRFGGIGSC